MLSVELYYNNGTSGMPIFHCNASTSPGVGVRVRVRVRVRVGVGVGTVSHRQSDNRNYAKYVVYTSRGTLLVYS